MTSSSPRHRATPHPAQSGISSHDAARQLDATAAEAHAHELLEALDDAMFSAITGHEGAMDQARRLWAEARDGAPRELLQESRDQYLRYAAEVVRRCELSERRNPATAIAALEIIEFLTSEALRE